MLALTGGSPSQQCRRGCLSDGVSSYFVADKGADKVKTIILRCLQVGKSGQALNHMVKGGEVGHWTLSTKTTDSNID